MFDIKSDEEKAKLYRISAIAYTHAIKQYNKSKEEASEVEKDTKDSDFKEAYEAGYEAGYEEGTEDEMNNHSAWLSNTEVYDDVEL